jgi:transcription antitermination factor NusG
MPNESRIAEEHSLLIMDILVELEDGSLANVEAQKIGYNFPGQRCACYSADLLLRQYKRVRSQYSQNNQNSQNDQNSQNNQNQQNNKKFSYRDIKTVYTIVFFEKSPKEFYKFPNEYIHKFQQVSDTGITMDLLQRYIFVPLDIFQHVMDNKGITSKLDAWLMFLSTDKPERIAELISRYPEFGKMYEELYNLCRNVEEVMGMFSKELLELDKNTVDLMIDEMQEEINKQKQEIEEQKQAMETALAEKDQAMNQALAEKDQAMNQALAEKDALIKKLQAQIQK